MTLESFMLRHKVVEVSPKKMAGEIHHQNGIEIHQKLPIDGPKKTEAIF